VIIVFLGPSLKRSEARKLLRADYRPPARQGDVFRAIEAGPEAIVLIDGVFESAPSVWHHELIAAHAAGIPLFGASSMGALRAAEQPGVVTPLGEIARNFTRGVWNDDAAVALLHGDAASDYRPLTMPWVNVFATLRAARVAKVITAKQQREALAVAESIFYQSRTWRGLLAALPFSARLEAFAPVDLKARDARFALEHVSALSLQRRAPMASRLSSFVRRSRLGPLPDAVLKVRGSSRVNSPSSAPLPDPLPRGGEGTFVARDRQQPVESLPRGGEGVKTLLLADFARQAGLTADPERVAHFRRALKVTSADLRESWAEALALEELVLSAPERFVPDGPSRDEGAALTHARR